MEEKKIKVTELDPNKFYIFSMPNDSFDTDYRFSLSEYLRSRGVTNFAIVVDDVEIKEKEDATLEVEEHWYNLQNS